MSSAMFAEIKKLPSIDVVIPAHNAALYIAETIKSVLQQTYQPSKIIIVDDGSTDATVDVVSSFKSEQIHLIKVNNGGVSKARNIGINASTSDLIAFLDADDVWLPQKLECQIIALTNYPNAKVAYSGTSLINARGEDIPNSTGVPYIQGHVFEDILIHERPVYGSASAVIVFRDVLDKAGYFDEKLNFSEDVDLWARLAYISDFTYTKNSLVRIRQHNQSATRINNIERKKEILAQHFYYLNKWSDIVSFPKEVIELQLKKIILLFFSYSNSITELISFLNRIKKESPGLNKLFGSSTIHILLRMISLILSVFPSRVCRRLSPVKRLKLLISEGTIFFRHSMEFNSEAESMRKKK